MKLTKRVLNQIVSNIIEIDNIDRIILFGSSANGYVNQDSDVDLLILKSQNIDFFKDNVRIRDALRGLNLPFDIIVMSLEKFESTKHIIGGLAYPASKYGKVIYDKAA